MILRPYQQEAKQAFYDHLRDHDDNPCVVIPTGAGKSPLMASICSDVVNLWNGRIAVLAHVRELLEQTADKIRRTDPSLPIGIYSAGLKSRQTKEPIIVAGIQSVYRRACDFEPFDLILVDEAHLIPLSGDGMYQQFLEDCKIINPNVRIGGLTATPYRLDCGSICRKDAILNRICYEIGVKELIRDGYLCQMRGKRGSARANLSNVHVRGGEYIPEEMALAFDQSELVSESVSEIIKLAEGRKGILAFCSSVEHARNVCAEFRNRGQQCEMICGETPSDERAKILADFQAQRLRIVTNCNVLTTGFDATHVDCIALLRATLSPGLYYQMVGRGFRIHDGKENCIVLDYGENIVRHGCVDDIRIRDRNGEGGGSPPVKECPECHELIHTAYASCPYCGHLFPPRELKHGPKASEAEIITSGSEDTTYDVLSVQYSVHLKKGNPYSLPTMRVDYSVGWELWKSEWVCFDHDGYARDKAEQWWKLRSTMPCPDTVEEAVNRCRAGLIAEPSQIVVRTTKKDKFPRIIRAVIAQPFSPGDEYVGLDSDTVVVDEQTVTANGCAPSDDIPF